MAYFGRRLGLRLDVFTMPFLLNFIMEGGLSGGMHQGIMPFLLNFFMEEGLSGGMHQGIWNFFPLGEWRMPFLLDFFMEGVLSGGMHQGIWNFFPWPPILDWKRAWRGEGKGAWIMWVVPFLGRPKQTTCHHLSAPHKQIRWALSWHVSLPLLGLKET